jgi:hypothetical protein
MPITGRFDADFASFYEACTKAEVHLKSFEDGAGKVETSLNRMVDNFSGRKVISEAILMTEAVDRIGGVSKLTQAELQKVGAVASEAVHKLDALGSTVPANMRKLADTAQGAGHEVGQLAELGQKFVAAFALEKVIEKTFEWVADVIFATAELEKLERSTGINTDSIQRLGYIGKEFGVDLETMTRGVEQFSDKLAHGDANATRAVEMLGLSVKGLIAAGPEEAFLQFAEAAGRVEDPMLKAALASDGFGGKLGKTLLPMLAELRQKMNDVPADAIISKENIKAAAEFDTGLQQLTTRLKSWTATTLGYLVTYNAWLERQGAAPAVLDAQAAAVGRVAAALPTVITAEELLTNRLIRLREDGMMPLSAAQQAEIVELESYGVAQKEIATLLHTSEIAVKLFTDAHKLEAEAAKKVAAEEEALAKKYTAAIVEMTSAGDGWKGTLDTIDGAVVEGIRHYLEAGVAQDKLATAYGLTAAQVKSVATAMTEEAAAMVVVVAQQAQLRAATDEYYKVVNAAGRDNVAHQIDDAYLAADAKIAAMTKAKNYSVEAEMMIWKAADQTAKNIIAGTLEQDNYTRAHYELLKDQAQDAYDFATQHADQFTSAMRDHLHDALVKSRDDLSNWRTVADTALTSADDKAKKLADDLAKAAAALRAMGSVQQVDSMNFAGQLQSFGFGGFEQTATSLAKLGYSFEQIIWMLKNPGAPRPTPGPRIPGFRDGVENFSGGPAWVGEDGPEVLNLRPGDSITPAGGGASITNNFYVNGTAEDVARQIGAMFMETLKSGRLLRSA